MVNNFIDIEHAIASHKICLTSQQTQFINKIKENIVKNCLSVNESELTKYDMFSLELTSNDGDDYVKININYNLGGFNGTLLAKTSIANLCFQEEEISSSSLDDIDVKEQTEQTNQANQMKI